MFGSIGEEPQKLSDVLEDIGVRLMQAVPKQAGLTLNFYQLLMDTSGRLAACVVEARLMEGRLDASKE